MVSCVDETVAVLDAVMPHRIGHGAFLHPEVGGQENLVNLVQRHQIPIGEVNRFFCVLLHYHPLTRYHYSCVHLIHFTFAGLLQLLKPLVLLY